MRTTIGYQVSNIALRDEVYYNWKEFITILNQGPAKMSEQLLNLWNGTKQRLSENKDIELLDLNKNISILDFEITSNVTKNNTRVFYFIFPSSDEAMAQSKCVALALTDKMPRYFTMEYFSIENGIETFVLGEWEFNLEVKDFKHKNYGKLTNPTIDNFASRVHEELEKN